MTLALAFLDGALESLAGNKLPSGLAVVGDGDRTDIRADRPPARWLIGEWT